ncbi:glutamine synthetase family protein, partial [Ruminococcus sp. CAG:379]|uniref:glutamine synthetase family protein n=1 Tax=Ruminococcus sp. CAG:379 TaxID=1262956 RepID=UPI00258BEF83
MKPTIQEISAFVRENDVKFIRLAFCDLYGVQKNISILPSELLRAYHEGIPFDASAIAGFTDVTESDLFLVPELSTLSALPWRPQQGGVIRFYCDIKRPDGSIFESDTRATLKRVVEECRSMDYACRMGTECEFYLFKTDENGAPTAIPLDGGSYCDVAPLDKGENVRREICLCLEEMGITPETSHHEVGSGQNEIDFKTAEPLAAAENLLTFQTVVRNISARNGLSACFLPKPLPDQSSSGMHVNLTLLREGQNLFASRSEASRQFMAGILHRSAEMTAFLNPIANSYDRLGSNHAPLYISWSPQNRSQLIRLPAATGDKVQMQLRSPDPMVNPYLAFSLILAAGLEGIRDRRE